MDDPDAKPYNWLVARERGEDIGHVLAAERAPYERLGELIGSGMAPGAGWRQRVLDAIDAEPAAAPGAAAAPEPVTATKPATATAKPPAAPAPVVPLTRKQRRWIAGGLAALAAAAAAIVVIPRLRPHPSGSSQLVALATEVSQGSAVVRGDTEAKVGDTLVVRAETLGPAELRVYGGSGERLIGACNDQPGQRGCTVARDGEHRRFVLEVPLEVPGMARAVIFLGAKLPASTGSLAADQEAAASAKIPTETHKPTRVL
jgi:hypothetical protein